MYPEVSLPQLRVRTVPAQSLMFISYDMYDSLPLLVSCWRSNIPGSFSHRRVVREAGTLAMLPVPVK